MKRFKVRVIAAALALSAFAFTTGFARAAEYAAGTAGYLKSATYYSDDWVINFWNSESKNMDAELAQIAEDGFNSIILVIPWREFQPGTNPITYNTYPWDKLDRVMEAAAVPVGILGVAAVTMPKFAYRFDRIKYWLDPFSDPTDKGFQIIQSLYAVASGGFFGLGIGQSRQKTYVPEPYNDIIFAIICEELGMFGAAVVILLFAILVCRGIKIAMNAEDTFGSLCATGITALIGIQAIINIAVATNTMPNTGMALPFISYGGSGMVFTLSSMGILLNISRYQRGRE